MEINPEQEFSRVVLNAIANRDRTIDAQTLLSWGDGVRRMTNRQPLMTDAELRNPLQYLLINQLSPPLLRNAVPDEHAGAIENALANLSRHPEFTGGSGTGDLQTLKSQVEELRRMVQEQQTRIGELQQRLGNL